MVICIGLYCQNFLEFFITYFPTIFILPVNVFLKVLSSLPLPSKYLREGIGKEFVQEAQLTSQLPTLSIHLQILELLILFYTTLPLWFSAIIFFSALPFFFSEMMQWFILIFNIQWFILISIFIGKYFKYTKK